MDVVFEATAPSVNSYMNNVTLNMESESEALGRVPI